MTKKHETKHRSKLALYGGPMAVPKTPPDALRWPRTGKEEIAACAELIQSGQLSFGKYTALLEREFASMTGVKYALACNNGTAAGHSCFFAINIQPGDEVICPTLTFWASIMQVLSLGGVPVFCEVDPKTGNLDPADVERRVTKRTKAILVVHLLGMPADMDRIMRIARKYNLKVIEDAAHGHGASYRGKMVGSFGDASFLSFQTTKLMVGGEAGIFLTNSKDYYERAVALGHWRMTLALDSPMRRYGITSFGYKYRVHPLAAAIAYCQLKKLPAANKRILRNVERFMNGLKKLKLWYVPKIPKHIKRVYYENWMLWKRDAIPGLTKDALVAALRAEGCVVSGARYPLLHEQPVFTEKHLYEPGGAFPALYGVKNKPVYKKGGFPVSDALRQDLVSVPTFPGANAKFVDQYLRAFKKVEDNADEIIARGIPEKLAKKISMRFT